jgi:hypothetical protein
MMMRMMIDFLLFFVFLTLGTHPSHPSIAVRHERVGCHAALLCWRTKGSNEIKKSCMGYFDDVVKGIFVCTF